jgi:hypothetical protein
MVEKFEAEYGPYEAPMLYILSKRGNIQPYTAVQAAVPG